MSPWLSSGKSSRGTDSPANRPDDSGTEAAGTLVSMNEVINASINVTDDVDWFRIQSLGDKNQMVC